MKRTPTSLEDYLEIASRRRWCIVLSVVIISVLTFFGSLCLPRSYRSEAVVLIEPQKVPANYVQSTVTEDVNDRLQAIRQEILSRARLRRIITEFNLYDFAKSKNSGDEIVEMMRRDISVEPVVSQLNTDKSSKKLTAFRISYSGPNPGLAQKVTRNLASLFIEENLKDREQESEGTTDFLDAELEKIRQSLQEQENHIEAFKSAHAGELPEQQMPSLQMLGQLQSVLQGNSDAITRAQQQKAYMSSVLESMQMLTTPQSMKSMIQLQYDAKTAELLAAQQKYRSNHPDVVRLKAELAALKKQIDAEQPTGWGGDGHSQATPDQIRVELAELDKEIAKRTARQTQLEAQIQQLQMHMSALPRVEQQLAELTRDYDTSRTSYQALLAKRNNSSVAAEMERRAQGEQFRMLDPASYPEKPYKPDLMQINALGLLGGFFFGCALAILREMSDSSLRSEHDLSFCTNAPVLALISKVPDQHELRRTLQRRLLIVAASCITIALMVFLAYLQRSSIATGFGWRL